MKRFVLFFATIICLMGWGNVTFAKVPTQHIVRIDDHWQFLRGDISSIWEAVRPYKKGSPESAPLWTTVNLPHCFNAADCVAPYENYYQGPGWYKKNIEVNNPYANGRVLLNFEGSGQKTDVYVYTTKVGSHVGGYDEWTVDITDAVEAFRRDTVANKRFGGKVPIAIRCDNSRDAEMIPSTLSDFNIYGGLYRHVSLAYVPATYLDRLQIDAQLDANLKSANVSVLGLLAGNVGTAQVRVVLKNPQGKVITQQNGQFSTGRLSQLCRFSIHCAILWSPDEPNLYTCEVEVEANGQKQTTTQTFGLRKAEFVDNGPFRLNGSRLLLRGTHIHQDFAGVAAAVTDEMMEREMRMIKDMGANFVRLGHYQQSDTILALCDKLGLLVWEEIPWCRGGLGGESYQEQAKRMLTNMIAQHRNHPCVILWGLGNENDWPNEFPDFDKQHIRQFMSSLNDLAHQLDSSRMTTIRRCDFCKDIPDVYSPTIWEGWYHGVLTDYKKTSEQAMKKVRHFFHAEWGADSHAGRNAEDALPLIKQLIATPESQRDQLPIKIRKAASKGDWSETYMALLMDWHLKEQETMPWLTGSAFWTFKDFATPVRPDNPIPYVNQKGVVQRDLTPKEPYYVVQSYWSKRPMLHIYGYDWPVRWGGADEEKDICVYSNQPSVELFVNGKSWGVRKRDSQDYPAAGLHWSGKLKAGENVVLAVSKGKQHLTDTIRFQYEIRKWQQPASLTAKLVNINAETMALDVQLVDTQGVPCLDASGFVRFSILGDARLVKDMGTATGSQRIQLANGRARILIHPGTGKAMACVETEDHKVPTTFVEIETLKQ